MALGAGLAACGGGASTAPPQTARNLAVLEPVQAGALVPRVRDLLRNRQSARQANPAVTFDRLGSSGSSAMGAQVLALAASPAAAVPLFSGSNIQEAGVDEADLLKTDGRLLFAQDGYTLRDSSGDPRPQLRVARAGAAGAVEPVATLELDTLGQPAQAKGLMLSERSTRLVALSTTPAQQMRPCPPGMLCALMPTVDAGDPMLHVQIADVGPAGTLSTTRRLALEGELVASRRVGDVVYLVTTWNPRLPYEALPGSASDKERETALAAIRLADVLPGVRIDGGARQALVAESDCLMQPGSSSMSLRVTTLLAIDLGASSPVTRSRCYFGGAEGLYMSSRNLYLATTRSPQPATNGSGATVFADSFVTDIHKFAFDGLSLAYRASGEVKGHLGWDPERIALRMSESGTDLRVITYTGASGWVVPATGVVSSVPATPAGAGSPATLTVLRESSASASLQVVGMLPNERRPAPLGKAGEQIHGVRFSGDTGYLVTFRRTDPLYVLDLKDPTDPKAAGVLEVPGFSDFLLPLPQGLLLGVGRDADTDGMALGPLVSLFDVRDPTRPAPIGLRRFGARGSVSAIESSPHGLNLLQVGTVARLALPMSLTLQDWGAEARLVLQRFEVDTTARTISWRTEMAAPQGSQPQDVSAERSVQIGQAVFYLSQGQLLGRPW